MAMPLFETGRGTRRELSVPSGTGWDVLDRAQSKHLALLAQQRLLFRKQGSLANKIRKLEEADRRAGANALFEDPNAELAPNPQIEETQKELDAVKHRVTRLEGAIDQAEAELVSLIETNREAWAEEVSPQVDAAYADYAEKIDALEQARMLVSAKWSLYSWLRDFSSGDPKRASYKPSSGSYVLALKQLSGDPHLFATVVDALRKDVRPPDPGAPESFIPWGDTAFRAAQAARASS
jgi:hypothetical protein